MYEGEGCVSARLQYTGQFYPFPLSFHPPCKIQRCGGFSETINGINDEICKQLIESAQWIVVKKGFDFQAGRNTPGEPNAIKDGSVNPFHGRHLDFS